MRLFASPSMTALLQRFRPPEGEPVAAPILNRSIETAQKRIEGRNYMIRKHTLEYDDVMNKQRQEIYSFRHEMLYVENPFNIALEMLEDLCELGADKFFKTREKDGGWNPEGFRQWLAQHFPTTFEPGYFEDDLLDAKTIAKRALERVLATFHEKINIEKQKAFFVVRQPNFDPQNVINDAVRSIIVRTVDNLWQEHLLTMDHLRQDVSLRSVGQKDPLMEFKQEAFSLFERFTLRLKEEIAQSLFKFEIVPKNVFQLGDIANFLNLETDRSLVSELEDEQEDEQDDNQQEEFDDIQAEIEEAQSTREPEVRVRAHHIDSDDELGQTTEPITVGPKVGRNDDCPCGSGKKFKKCCGIEQ